MCLLFIFLFIKNVIHLGVHMEKIDSRAVNIYSNCAEVGCLPSNSKVSKQRLEYHSVWTCNVEKESVLWEVTSCGASRERERMMCSS